MPIFKKMFIKMSNTVAMFVLTVSALKQRTFYQGFRQLNIENIEKYLLVITQIYTYESQPNFAHVMTALLS